MRTLTLLTAALAALAATAPSAIGQTVRIDASSTNSTAVAIGVGNSATTHTGVMGTDNITGFADLNARSRNAAALALGLYSNASLNVGGVGSSARARSVRTNASVNNAYALSIAPGSARATVGAVCSVRGGLGSHQRPRERTRSAQRRFLDPGQAHREYWICRPQLSVNARYECKYVSATLDRNA
jgi:hypothetical protein